MNKLNRGRTSSRHETRGKDSTTGFEIYRSMSPSTSSTFLTTSSMLSSSSSSLFPFKQKRTWIYFLLLGLISSTLNFVPNIVFADADSVRTEKQHVKPVLWDPVTSPNSNDNTGLNTTPVSIIDDLSTPPLTTPSNYRTWKNTNRVVSKKKDAKTGDDFHVGTSDVTNRVDVDWHNDVIAFEDEDDHIIDDDENIFYYYDDGGEDSYDGKSSMEGIHPEDEEEQDIVVFDGDIYPKVSIILNLI